MSARLKWLTVVLAIVGLAAGSALGLWYGWEFDPVEYTDTDIAHLHPVYKNEYILMVGKAYALDGDLDTARARLALLVLPDPANAVADLAEAAIERGTPPPQVRPLVQLAFALGAERPSFAPYLPAQGMPQ